MELRAVLQVVFGMAALVSAVALPAGDHTFSTRATNDTIIHVPPGYDGRSIPVVLALHGMGPNYPDLFQSEISMDAVADNHNFAVVYPLGSAAVKPLGVSLFGHTWNGGKCCFSGKDDLSFLLDVVNKTSQLIAVDPKRVYAFGFSAGGVMSHRLGCEASQIFAAVASVDGPIEVNKPCHPAFPTPVLHFHGTLDPVFPYNGAIYNGATQTIDLWKKVNQCTGGPTESKIDWRDTEYNYNCTTAVRLVSIAGGSHTMPPKAMHPEEYIWQFLSTFVRV